MPSPTTVSDPSLIRLGQYGEAISVLRKAIDLKPGFAHAHADLGEVLQVLGKLDEAYSESPRGHPPRPRLRPTRGTRSPRVC